MEQSPQYVIEMLHITKEFPGIKANDDITLQLRKGEIHALLGENGAGKSTLMSVLFGLYQPEEGEIRKNGKPVKINDPNDATALGIGMVHQHFKLIDVFTVLDNIILGAEDTKMGFLQKKAARQKVQDLSQRYGLREPWDFLLVEGEYAVPLVLQLLLVELIIDVLKLASLNTPDVLGNSFSMLGALILGDFAVQSRWLVPEVLVYMAFAA